MKIGIIGGTGREGKGIALRWARAGHDVTIGSRDGERGRQKASELSQTAARPIAGGSNTDAVAAGEVVLLSVPYGAHASTLTGLAEGLSGKILIDITVPLKPPKVRRVQLPDGQAAALEAQALLGDTVHVAAALHHVSSALLADPDREIACDVLVCADKKTVRDTVIELIGDLGLRGLTADSLANAVALESLTPVLLQLNKAYGAGEVGVRFTGIPESSE